MTNYYHLIETKLGIPLVADPTPSMSTTDTCTHPKSHNNFFFFYPQQMELHHLTASPIGQKTEH